MSARVTACTSCRQVKLKCDVKETQPDACTRCRARELSCKMDPNFKRIPTRGRLAEVTRKLTTLQEALALGSVGVGLGDEAVGLVGPKISVRDNYFSQNPVPGVIRDEDEITRHTFTRTATATATSRSSLSQTAGRSIGEISVAPKRTCFDLDPMVPNREAFTMEPKRLGDVIVGQQTIEELFTNYYHYRHSHLPLIDTAATVSQVYESSAFLFWTIIHISCRHNPNYALLEHNLTAPYKDLLATTLITAVTSLQTVQALLLLCLYPFNIRHQHDEHSLNLCGFALSACLQMGLHHPDRLQDYGVLTISDSSIESRMTWMALFQISTCLSFTLGTPPLIQSPTHLEGIRLMCRNPSIPRSFVAQIEIQRHVARFLSTLEGQTDLQSRFSLTQVFDQELDSVRSDFEDAWSEKAEFNLLIAKLYLYSMYISPKSDLRAPVTTAIGGPHDPSGTSRRIILNLGLATVVRLVHIFRTKCGYHPSSQTQPNNMFSPSSSSNHPIHVEFFPKFYFRSMVFAACYLLYFLLSDPSSPPSPTDEITARTHIDAIHDIFKTLDSKDDTATVAPSMNGKGYRTYDVYRHAAETIDLLRSAMTRTSKDGNAMTRTRDGDPYGKRDYGHGKFGVESRMGAGLFFGAIRTGWEAQRRELLLGKKKSRESLALKQRIGAIPCEGPPAGYQSQPESYSMASQSQSNIIEQAQSQGAPSNSTSLSSSSAATIATADTIPMDLVAEDNMDFLWDEQSMNAELNFQWGTWGLPLMTPFGNDGDAFGVGPFDPGVQNHFEQDGHP